MARKDKNDSMVYRYLLLLKYEKIWDNYTDNKEINEILSHASKNGKGNTGIPDQIYVNERNKLLIIMEIKSTIAKHISKNGRSEPIEYAVDGVIHYTKHFLFENIKENTQREYFKDWKIVSIAISGDIKDDYNHRITTFIVINDKIQEQKDITDILSEEDYLNLFDNYDEEEIINNISSSSKKINKLLRSVDSQKRPVLLSALMICLFEVDDISNDFKNNYNSWTLCSTIVTNIPTTVKTILLSEEIPDKKINILLAELEFIKYDQDLNNTSILKDILNELRDTVIPLFKRKSNYDIIGKFYEDFLRYAGVANVKKGIVLTPHHITTLFTELIDIKVNDVILDICCGTGAFLIAGMNKLIQVINDSDMHNKNNKIKNLKKTQLIGFEKNPTMYSLAISNMLFRGDGKSQIFNYDCFSANTDKELNNLKNEKGIQPTIGFINPPYGGKDNKDNYTKKEIQFLTKMLDCVSRYGIIIAPLSTYLKDGLTRNSILSKHTLKYVINMPKALFMPNALTSTAIAVFETNIPHGNKEVIFYDLKDDGFVLTKSKGRNDVYNKWTNIKKDMLKKIKNPNKYQDGITLVKTQIKENEEWIIQSHSKTDYSTLSESNFIHTIKEYMVFNVKREMNLINKEIDELSLLEVISSFYKDIKFTQVNSISKSNLKLNTNEWGEFNLDKELFFIERGVRLTIENRVEGGIPLVTAGYENQGIAEYISNEEMAKYNSAITIDMFGNCFYRDYDFCCDDNIIVLKPKFKINKYIALFIISIINQDKYKFSYARQYRLKHIKKHKIKLPRIQLEKINLIEEKEKVDYKFMENYIKSLAYGDKL